MKRILVLTLVALIAGACSALQAPPAAAPAPAVDSQATIDSMVQTAAAQTMAAQPSPTIVPATETGTPVVASSPTTESLTETPSPTSIPNLTTTPVTATVGTEDPSIPTSTPTLASPSGSTTPTPTFEFLLWGTLPPAVPWAPITINNKSKTQAYISLQNDPPHQVAIMEYFVKKQVKIRGPVGYYDYVVWVGGRQIVGNFNLGNGDDLTITIYRDKVTLKFN